MITISKAIRAGFLILPLFPPQPVQAAAPEPVAIVYRLEGGVSVTVAEGAKRRLSLFERLPEGAILEVEGGSRLTLAFANGLRFELEAGARVTLGSRDLASRSGPVRAFPRVPSFPLLAPIAPADCPGAPGGAIRIRSERIEGLYPRHGTTALPGAIVLRFQPVDGARNYRIEIQDDRGIVLFQAEAESPLLKVPSGTLSPGSTYLWTVRTVDRVGPVARGEAELRLLSEDASRGREESRRILVAADPGSLPLLAEIDRGLGLWLEAEEELRAALQKTAGDPELTQRLAELVRCLEEEP